MFDHFPERYALLRHKYEIGSFSGREDDFQIIDHGSKYSILSHRGNIEFAGPGGKGQG
jgi:hypothetical protein